MPQVQELTAGPGQWSQQWVSIMYCGKSRKRFGSDHMLVDSLQSLAVAD